MSERIYIPEPIAVTLSEGGEWFHPAVADEHRLSVIAAVAFPGGMVWDVITQQWRAGGPVETPRAG